jgi:hypothetical protein
MKWRAFFLALVATFAPAMASAAPITFAFAGFVDEDPLLDPADPFGGTIALDTLLSGAYTFDSTTPDGDASAAGGSYTSPGGTFSLSLGGNAFSATDLVNVGVLNDAGADFYTVRADDTSGADPFGVSLLLLDFESLVFGSAALPTDAPAFSEWDLATFFLEGTFSGNQVQISGTLTSLTCVEGCIPVNPVPEPASVAVLGIGLAAAFRWRHARRRRMPPVRSRFRGSRHSVRICRSGREEETVVMTIAMNVRTMALALVAAIVPTAAFAVDGVVLVDQAKAMAGNVTPGDAPGFPVTFTLPGSYRLASNLVVPAGVDAGIQINADDVTIDLNGFTLRGTGHWVAPYYGVDSTGRKRSKVRNGSIVGFTVAMQFRGAASFVTLEQLVIDTTTVYFDAYSLNGTAAIVGGTVHAYPLIRGVQTNGNIQLTCPGVVVDTIADSVWERAGIGYLQFPNACTGSNVAQQF